MNSLPPYFTTEIFNNSAFYKSYDYLTREQADKLYLSINALSNLNLDSLNVAVKGIAEPEKCLITNATNDISNINILSSNIISTTSRIETQNTSTTLITSSSNCDNYGLHLHSVLASSNGIYPGTSIAFNNSSLDNVPLANICLDKIGSGNGNLIFSVRNGTNCLEVARILSTGLNIAGNLNLTTPTAGFQTLLNAVNTSSNVTCQIQVGNTETFIGNSSNHNTVIMGNGSRLITCLPGGNIAIGGTTTTYKLGVNGTLNCTNLYRNDTICDLPLIQGVTTIGTCYANKVLTCNGTLDTIGLNSLTSTILICDTLSKTGTLNVTPTTLNLNPTTLQLRGTTISATGTEINILSGVTATTADLNYTDITTLGTFQVSKVLTLDASGRGIMPLGTDDTNCIRYSSGTTFRETINLYRTSDTTGLIIASKTNGVSTSKSYPILRLISTSDPANLGTGSGVAATTNDLLRMDWNDKPTTGFTSQTHRLCFDIGNTRPYYTAAGYPHTFGISTSANALSLSVNSSSAIPTSNCLYLVNDTINKLLYNTNTAYTNADWGTANITLNEGNIFIKSSNDLNGDSTAYDMPLMMVSSHATPVAFGVEIHNGSSGTSANAAFVGTLTSNALAFMTGNNRRMTILSTGYVGIGTGTPVAPLQVSTNISYTWNSSGAVGTTVYRLRTDSGNTETATGTPITYTNVTAIFNGYIGCEAMVMQSDRRLKTNITNVPIERVECFYKELQVKSFNWKKHLDKPKELGLIAQDVLNGGFLDLIARIPDSDEELENSKDPWLEPKNEKLHVDYSKISIYNMRMIQALINRIEELEKKIR